VRHGIWNKLTRRKRMFGFVVYGVVCFILSGVFTLAYMLIRPLRLSDDVQSWRVMSIMFLLLCLVPYCYVEGVTYVYADTMEDAVDEAIWEAGIDGDLLYYKVIGFRKGSARVIAVASEPQPGFLTERPVLTISLSRSNKNTWEVESVDVAHSMKRNRDRLVFPPYW
jgi:hypothetical protein